MSEDRGLRKAVEKIMRSMSNVKTPFFALSSRLESLSGDQFSRLDANLSGAKNLEGKGWKGRGEHFMHGRFPLAEAVNAVPGSLIDQYL